MVYTSTSLKRFWCQQLPSTSTSIHGAVLQGWMLDRPWKGWGQVKRRSCMMTGKKPARHLVVSSRWIASSRNGRGLVKLNLTGLLQCGGLFCEVNKKYVGVTVPLLKTTGSLLVLATDRTLAFETIPVLQLAIVGSTIALALMICFSPSVSEVLGISLLRRFSTI